MKILSIGNSFSHDAHTYLHKLAKKEGEVFKTVNLYISGCSLETHYLNCLEDKMAYEFGFNGENTKLKTSIKQALTSDEWDIVTIQQASHFSPNYESYFPYVESIVEYVKKYCPNAKIYIHQTWAYEDGCERLNNLGYSTAKDMFNDIAKSYNKVAKVIKADGIIPSGQAMINAVDLGIEKIHRDTYHASLGAGRYLLALTWYKALTGKDISNNAFDEFDLEVSDKERKIVIKAVNSAF